MPNTFALSLLEIIGVVRRKIPNLAVSGMNKTVEREVQSYVWWN